MMFTSPLWLLALPLALMPLMASVLDEQRYPSFADLGNDPLSTALDWAIRLLGIVAIAALILGNAGIASREQELPRLGEGAHIVLLMDRSSSMDNTFAGRQPSGEEESKSEAARRLLKAFVADRAHDRFGIAAFSTAPMVVLPLTDHKDILFAAIDAMDRPGLAFTDVGRGLALALKMHNQDTSSAPRAIVLVSDGAAVIGRRLQEDLRAAFAKRSMRLYWLFLRTAGTRGIFAPPADGEDDTPQVLPERHLNKFFESLRIPYKAYEAENPTAVQTAIEDINRLERMPIAYTETTPRIDRSWWAYLLAFTSLLALAAVKLVERPISTTERRANA